jgi:hypothetical protein
VDIVLTVIIMAILIAAVFAIIAEKRKGAKCAGCPYSHSGRSGCSCGNSKKRELL